MPIMSLNAIINRNKFLHSQPYTSRVESPAEQYILIVLLKSSASSEDWRVVFAVL